MRIVLASSSPRRKEILKLIGLKSFDVIPPFVEEKRIKTPVDVKVNALIKAKAVAKIFEKSPEEYIVIASDTAVFLDNTFLGKPKDEIQAKQMLKKLSGRWHIVYTSLAVIYGNKTKRETKLKLFSTRVKFAKLTPEALKWYLSTGEPFDKAGAYGIQGFGAIFIEKLVGDYFTVMGLPARGLFEILTQLLGEKRVFELLKNK